MKIISVKENPAYKDIAINYLQSKWPSVYPIMYEDSINHCIDSPSSFPQWYLLEKDDRKPKKIRLKLVLTNYTSALSI